MALIKRTPADIAFSMCIRIRDNYTCQVCGTSYLPNDSGLHCSHFHGRGNWAVRFDPGNAEAHCYNCHIKMGGSPHDFTDHWKKKLGPDAYQALLDRKRDLSLGKMYRQTKGKGDIAKYFRDEFQRMQDEKFNYQATVNFEAFI